MSNSRSEIVVDGVKFTCVGARTDTPPPGEFYLRKTRWMADRYRQLAAEFPGARIMELGIDQGASTAYLGLSMAGARIAAVDISAQPAAALVEFLARRGLDERVIPYWGVDQSDSASLRAIVESVFTGHQLDMVIDDASHEFQATTASLEALLPLVRPGGVYVIEDWDWETQLATGLERAVAADPRGELAARLAAAAPAAGRRGDPLSRLVLELSLLAARRPDIVSELTLRRGWAEFRRGEAALGPGFRLAEALGDSWRGVLSDRALQRT